MITFLINRARRHWQVLSTVLLGVLISTAFLASGPIIVNTVIDFALPHKLRSSLNENGILYLTTYNNQGEYEHNEIKTNIHNILTTNLGEIQEIVDSTASPWIYPWQEGSLIPDERINLRSYGGIEQRIKFVSGGWPQNPSLDPRLIQAVISTPMADAFAIGVGDHLPISKRFNELQPSYWIEVSGIYQPIDASDLYWLIESNPFQTTNNNRYAEEFGAILLEEDFFSITENLFPNANHQLIWLGIINPGSINSSNLKSVITGIETIRTSITAFERRVVLETNLDGFLENYETQAAAIIPPLYLLIGEVLFLGLYYVVMVAALSIRQVEGELSTLVSRGAEISQLLRIQVFDALLICITAFIFGPILAYGLISSLARIGPLADVSQTDWVTRLPSASWLAAGISVFACFTALIVPVIPILRSSVVQHHQTVTRRKNIPWWHRYYIDVLLLSIGLVALWRLSLYGSISGINQGNIDWLLLFAPLALLIGSATVLLRLFPSIFRMLAFFVARGRGLTAAIALWQTARDPTHVTRLILLFTLAMALGILSTGLNATLSFSEKERARYSTGGEARLSFDNFIPLSSLDSLPQVNSSSAIWRGTGRANVRSYRNIPDFSILAIDPLSFATVSQFRTDYTDDYIGYVLGQLIVDPEQLPVSAIALPSNPTHLGLWIFDPNPNRTDVDILEYVNIRAKIQSAEGEIDVIDLDLISTEFSPDGVLINPSNPDNDSTGWFHFLSLVFKEMEGDSVKEAAGITSETPSWLYFEALLPEYAAQGYPLSLHSMWIKIRRLPSESEGYSTSQGPLIIDDLSVRDSSGTQKVFEDFEELTTIWQTDSVQSLASYTKRDITHSGEASMRLFLGSPDSSNWMVLSPAQTTRINFIPILASPVFLEMTELKVGDKFSAFINGISLILEIKNSVNYFPTMYETDDYGFVVVSRDSLLAELNRSSRIPINYNEIWLRVDETQEIPGLLSSFPLVKRSWEVISERMLFKSDPLTLGLRSVIFLGYSLTLFLSLVGFATYFYMSARQRGSIYGILRSLGFSTPQLYGSLVLEQTILIFSGLGLGILLGSILNKIILPGLPISFADLPPIPPFVPQTDWYSVARLILIMIGGFFFTLAIGTFLLWKLKLHQVLRIGEE